jgi:hypothetical protein
MPRGESGMKPCPFCQREISSKGLAQISHQRAHVRAGEAVEVEYPGPTIRRGKRTRRGSDSRVFMTPTTYEEYKDRIAASRGYVVKPRATVQLSETPDILEQGWKSE